MTKKDMLKCYKDFSTCDMDKVTHVVNAIYQAFDTDNDGKVGMRNIINFIDWILIFCLNIDFNEFLIGFLLTTKGSMEEKLDYTFQIYGKIINQSINQKLKFYFFLDIDKDGYIDQSEIDIMAKVFSHTKKRKIF